MGHVFDHLNLVFGQFPIVTAKTYCGGRCMFGCGAKLVILLKIHLPVDVLEMPGETSETKHLKS